ncbi:glycerophosphodiester phosphodiesterase [Shewanella waksmanii]|uniref:glycerophosphodiester phosphodiesterase n=1 Tax=Shewanella waksmanii TaxID=213783 RepID=UPI00048B16D2|nr:glycerophosphodiester phosphodiesterase family protein [Shewanella waksmanii]
MLVFAHRGASGYAPDNTLSAMQKAIALGCKAIELDVQNVAGELMLFHNRWLDGETNANGLIESLDQQSIAQVMIQGQPLANLWQVLQLCQHHEILINIELKGMNSLAPFLALYPKMLTELNYPIERLLISSFNHKFLQSVKQRYPSALIAPLLEGLPIDNAAIGSQLDAYSIHLDINFIDADFVRDAHQRGLKVYVYTVDKPHDIAAMHALGVDGIFSNYPDQARQYITSLS